MLKPILKLKWHICALLRAKMVGMHEALYCEFGPDAEFICDVPIPIVKGVLNAPSEAPEQGRLNERILHFEVMSEGTIQSESADESSGDDTKTCARNRRVYSVLLNQPIPAALAAIPGALFVWSEMRPIKSSKWNVATLNELYSLLVTHISLRYSGVKDWKSCKQDEAEAWSSRCKRIGGQTITPAQVQEWVRNKFKRTPFKNWMGKLDAVVLARNHNTQHRHIQAETGDH